LDNIKRHSLDLATKGMTLVELVVAIVAGSMIALVISSLSLDLFAGLTRGQTETTMLMESQLILSDITEDFRTSSAILATNTISDSHAPSEGWNTSNENLILIASEPAIGVDRNFIIDPLTGGPYRNEYILFADNNVLRKRILANPNAIGNIARTSCPPLYVSSTCPEDSILTEHFHQLNFIFYDQDGAETTDPTLGRSIEINIHLRKNVFGELITADNRIRMTLRNASLN